MEPMTKVLELARCLEASQDLIASLESFRSKVMQAFEDKLIVKELYADLMMNTRDTYILLKTNSMYQERIYERNGGRFYEAAGNLTPKGFLLNAQA